MKKLLILASASVMVMGLGVSGCTPGHNVPGSTLVGATAGGLIASQLFHGRGAFAGVIAGALLGGIVGNKVGNYMDAQDRINMRSAITTTPVGQQASWKNSKGVSYTVRPVKNYKAAGHHCRRYWTKVVIGGKTHSAYGKACRVNGRWKIVH